MLHVSLLGERVITHDGTGVRARSSGAVELVAFLVAHAGSPRARQRFAGLLWPDSTEAQADQSAPRAASAASGAGAEPSLVVTSRICAGVIGRRGNLCP
jgi:hypothetical protein